MAHEPFQPPHIPRTCEEATDKYLDLAKRCLWEVHRHCLTEMLKPVYAKRALLETYEEESEWHRAAGDQVVMAFEDIKRMYEHNQPIKLMERDAIVNGVERSQ